METREEMFTKQYHNKESIYNNYIKRDVQIYSRPQHSVYHPYLNQRTFDEPIDLTQNPNRFIKTEHEEPQSHVHRRSQCAFKPRARRGRFLQENVLNESQLQNLFNDVIELQATETKQAEILKAAKSLFSKRTRTLYHWMYPNTPKAQIKLAVANSWENLGAQEKQFYISQVLVRFGFPQSNLMVNPQLGGIKELPPLPLPFDNTHSAKELQAAISSISGDAGPCCSGESGKRKQGRPPGSKNKKKRLNNDVLTFKLTKDFQDDPELSKELEKFATSFDWLK